ncbi:ATP-binding protein [Streptomyces sp. NPDC060022]|uniref:ATP-binding protein n=1 Tax=Streptomyces sp. NPDC060022 TaxID=3347039 RepID=UPI00369B4B05
MQHTGGELRPDHAVSDEDLSTQRVLLTLAARDYEESDSGEGFAEGIDQQLAIVREWWQSPGPLPAFRQLDTPPLQSREQVEDLLRKHGVREMRGDALVLFVTGHGVKGSSETHFLQLPQTKTDRPLATAVRTADIVAAALDSHVDNVLVIVNTCFAGNMRAELAGLLKEIRPRRRSLCKLDVLVTCGHDKKIEVLRFSKLLQGALKRLRTNAGITTPYLTIPDFIAEYARGLAEDEESTFKLHRLVEASGYQPSPCMPNPGYTHLPETLGLLHQASLLGEYWLDRATGRPQESEGGWYFRGRRELNTTVAEFLGPHAERGVLLITGSAGSGKSAVLGRAVTLSDPAFRNNPLFKTAQDLADEETIPPEGSVTAAVVARHRDAAQVAGDLLRALGVDPARSGSRDDQVEVWSRQLVEHVRSRAGSVTIVLDALDEARELGRIVNDVLAPLAEFCHRLIPAQRPDEELTSTGPAARLLIGVRSSRPLDGTTAVSSPSEDLGLLRSLKEVFPAARVERTDGTNSNADIEEYLAALMGDSTDIETVKAVVPLVAKAVWPSFIDARLAGHQLCVASDPLALAQDPDWQKILKRGLKGLLTRDLKLVGEDDLPSDIALALLKAAAYAKGEGVPWGEVWPRIADQFLDGESLSTEVWDTMIVKLLTGRLSGYLAHSIEDDRRVYRPAHQELVGVLKKLSIEALASGGPGE